MAIFRTSAIVGGISGNVGGACFVNTRGSAVLRKSRTRSTPQTPARMVKQSVMYNAIIRWRELSDEKKKQWNIAALTTSFPNRLGEKRLLSGYQYFLKVNGLVDQDDPPQPTNTYPGLNIQWTPKSDNSIKMENIGPSSAITYAGLVEAMPLYRDNPPNFQNFYRSLGVILIVVLEFTFIEVQFNPIFGEPRLNQWIAFRWTTINDGLLTSQTFSRVVKTIAQ